MSGDRITNQMIWSKMAEISDEQKANAEKLHSRVNAVAIGQATNSEKIDNLTTSLTEHRKETTKAIRPLTMAYQNATGVKRVIVWVLGFLAMVGAAVAGWDKLYSFFQKH